MKQGDIILVPFPFSDLSSTKTRPAVVVSNNELKGEDVIVVGMTSQAGGRYSLSLEDGDLEKGILPVKSYLRYNKVVSLQKSMMRRHVGRLSLKKRKALIKSLKSLLVVQ